MTHRTMVYFGGTDWSFRWQPQQYICAEVARRGDEVIFVENTGVRWPEPRDAGRVLKRLGRVISTVGAGASREQEGVRAVPAIALPTHPSTFVRHFNRSAVTYQIRRAARQLSGDRMICWIGLPNWTALDVSRSLQPAVLIYYCGEEFAAVPQAHPSIRESERQLLAEADLVFATSRRLQLLCERSGRPVIPAPVGVDVGVFRDAAAGGLSRPSELRHLPGRVIGYLGGLNHKVDLRMLNAVTASFPTDSVVILGSVEDPQIRPAPASNLYILGERPYGELPAYLQHFDVCLIPYVRNEFTDSVCPAKLNDYLAAGRPVVSTALAEVLPFREVIRIAETVEEFVAHIGESLNEPASDERTRTRVAAAATRSYDVIVPAMLAAVEEVLASPRAARRSWAHRRQVERDT